MYILLCLANDVETNPGPQLNSVIRICHVNIQSMRRNPDKLTQISLQLVDFYDIITVSETWLSSDIPDADYRLAGYSLFRRDRPNDALGGGLAVWVADRFVVTRRNDLEIFDTEALWLELRSRSISFLLCTAYRPPNNGSHFWNNLQYMMDNAKLSTIRHVMIMGDLNADDHTSDGIKFYNFVNDNLLTSHISEPTRITPQSKTCLDRIASNMSNLVNETFISAP